MTLRPGFPIRKSADQRLLAPPHGLSQRATSFIASQCQGIHQMPLIRLIQSNQSCTSLATEAQRAASAHSALHNLDLTNHKSFITPASRTNPQSRHAGTKFKSIRPRSTQEINPSRRPKPNAPERPLAVSPCIRSTMSNSKPIGPKTDRQFYRPLFPKEPPSNSLPPSWWSCPVCAANIKSTEFCYTTWWS